MEKVTWTKFDENVLGERYVIEFDKRKSGDELLVFFSSFYYYIYAFLILFYSFLCSFHQFFINYT